MRRDGNDEDGDEIAMLRRLLPVSRRTEIQTNLTSPSDHTI